MNKLETAVSNWLSDRIKLGELLDFLHKKTVPRHKHSFWYFFGGLSLFFFSIQVITGILLLFYYSPTPATAYESVSFIIMQVPFGWLIRSFHVWSAHLMVACVFIHLFSTFFMRAYRKPREVLWITGVLQLFLVLGFAFTGSLLPWDMLGYFATQIGTEIPRTIPLIGEVVVKLLRGGEFVDEESLKRFFALHVAVLPIATLLLVGVHLLLNQVQGTSSPIGVKKKEPGIPFYPNFIYRDLLTWIFGLGVLFTLACVFPITLGPKANPFASAPDGIKPEWYFLPLYQTLKMLPSLIFGINSEVIVNSLVGIIGFLVIMIPFLDRKAANEEKNRVFTVCGVIGAVYMVLMIVMALWKH